MKLSPHNCAKVNIFTFLNFTKSGHYSDTSLENPFLNVCILEIGVKLADTFLVATFKY